MSVSSFSFLNGANDYTRIVRICTFLPLCATVGLASDAGIVSANIVGYNTITLDATDGESAYPSFGMSFVPVSGSTFNLKELKPVEGTFDPDSDNVQVIDPNTLECASFYAYVDATKAAALVEEKGGKAEDYIGWWDLMRGEIGQAEAFADEDPINVGDGFMGFFFGGNAVKFQSAGEAPTTSTDFTTVGGESYYQMFANYIPKAITLSQIVPQEGTLDCDSDNVQVIDPISLECSSFFAYVDATKAAALVEEKGGKAEDYIGWWDQMLGEIGDDAAKAGNYEVKEGAGFMGFFFSGNQITFQFPSSLD